MRTTFSFVFIFIIGFLLFIPILLIVIPMVGLKTFFVVVGILIIGFIVELIFKKE
ncbi:hypothetical protein ACFOZ1_01940 [Gracilibacillus marinus]|uniref:DUF3096 domain-containing protein n=1 Tax=Gracilibacillus marinus TaxID=630535 RepID=A0ABV8VUU6_9BACI